MEWVTALGQMGVGTVLAIVGGWVIVQLWRERGKTPAVDGAGNAVVIALLQELQATLRVIVEHNAEHMTIDRQLSGHSDVCSAFHSSQAALMATIIGNQMRILDRLGVRDVGGSQRPGSGK